MPTSDSITKKERYRLSLLLDYSPGKKIQFYNESDTFNIVSSMEGLEGPYYFFIRIISGMQSDLTIRRLC